MQADACKKMQAPQASKVSQLSNEQIHCNAHAGSQLASAVPQQSWAVRAKTPLQINWTVPSQQNRARSLQKVLPRSPK